MENPKIRFKGFTKDWEQRKVGDLVKDGIIDAPLDGNHGEKHPTASEYVDLGIPFLMASDVHNGIVNIKSCKFITSERAKRLDKGFTKNGDVLLTHKATIGESAILQGLETEYAVLTPQVTYYRIQDEERLSREYLYAFFNSVKFQNDLRTKAMQSTRPYIGISAQQDLDIVLPRKLMEQKKIGVYFFNLDHLITLHQRKCEQTKKLKKYMLQKMFPQNGAKVPEIRFDGFTYDWEQRKVTDLGEIYIGLVTTMTEHYTDKGHLLIRNSDIKDGYFEFGENPIYLDEEFSEQNKLRMHQLGDVITVHTGDIGTSAVIGENEVNSIGFATIVTRPNQEILDSNYFATYLNTDTHKQWAVSMATGDGRSNYNLKDYTKLVVPIPEIEEQKKIAACIVNLNSLITLHQRKCDELKKMKKYMLQNMFI